MRWFAEGTSDAFDTRIALFNADLAQSSHVRVRFLRDDGVTITQALTLTPGARATIDPKTIAGLENTRFAFLVESDTFVVAERTAFRDPRHDGSHVDTGEPPSAARTPNAGAIAPATQWFFAEGATGPFFDTTLLVANPTVDRATLSIAFLRADAAEVVHHDVVAPHGHLAIPLSSVPGLLPGDVSTIVTSTNRVPVVVERTMRWPGPAFAASALDEHTVTGAEQTGTQWAFADGQVGLDDDSDTYLLIANTSAFGGAATIRLHFEDGATATRTIPLAARSRRTVRIAALFPEAVDRRFAASVQSIATANPASTASPDAAVAPQLVVERSMYSSDTDGHPFAAGTAVMGTRVPPGTFDPDPDAVTVSVSSTMVFEQGARGAMLTFRRGKMERELTVAYAVSGTATPGQDFVALSGRVAFAIGQASATVPIVVREDREQESTETIAVDVLARPEYRTGAPARATVRLFDNDTRAAMAGGGITSPDEVDASRFLTQATFGPRDGDVARLRAIGFDAWFDEQVSAPRTGFLARLEAASSKPSEDDLGQVWTTAAVGRTDRVLNARTGVFEDVNAGPDQLRQRVSNALLEILVVSNVNGLGGKPIALAAYMDILQRHAFGNFRALLQEVTLSPAMGQYLSHLKNDKPGLNHDPDENYAREILQLFTIGMHQLQIDGTPVRTADGALIATYDQEAVEGLAHVFTGWTYGHTGAELFDNAPVNWKEPMRGIPSHHSTIEKRLFVNADGVRIVLPANQSMTDDLTAALDRIFEHPNVGPFIGRQLIQRLVTSNPSPDYIGRVAATFADNGQGVRGDLQAVVRQILLDPEARTIPPESRASYGHLREPMIRYVTALRALNADTPSHRFNAVALPTDIGQAPFKSPSVFNFFEPNFQQPGPLADAGIYSPEFQLATERWLVSWANTMRRLIRIGYGVGDSKVRVDVAPFITLAADPGALADRLSVLLLDRQMSPALRANLVQTLTAIPARYGDRRAFVALTMVLASAEFAIQK